MKIITTAVLIVFTGLNVFAFASNAQSNKLPAGCYLKATINNIAWEAEKMTLDKYPSEILQVWGDRGNTSLQLQLNMPAQGKVDKMIETDLNNWTDEKFNRYGLVSGEVKVTKMDDKWVEGTFHMNMKDTRSGKQTVITSGSFRVPNPGQIKK